MSTTELDDIARFVFGSHSLEVSTAHTCLVCLCKFVVMQHHATVQAYHRRSRVRALRLEGDLRVSIKRNTMKPLVGSYVSQALQRIESDPNTLNRECRHFGVQHCRRADGAHGGGGTRTEQYVLVECKNLAAMAFAH